MKTNKLIKASIYRAGTTLARFTGAYNEAGVPIFSNHGETFASASFSTVTALDVRAYMGR